MFSLQAIMCHCIQEADVLGHFFFSLSEMNPGIDDQMCASTVVCASGKNYDAVADKQQQKRFYQHSLMCPV